MSLGVRLSRSHAVCVSAALVSTAKVMRCIHCCLVISACTVVEDVPAVPWRVAAGRSQVASRRESEDEIGTPTERWQWRRYSCQDGTQSAIPQCREALGKGL